MHSENAQIGNTKMKDEAQNSTVWLIGSNVYYSFYIIKYRLIGGCPQVPSTLDLILNKCCHSHKERSQENVRVFLPSLKVSIRTGVLACISFDDDNFLQLTTGFGFRDF